MSVVVTVANQKGGVGKTTTAIEIAACLVAKNEGYRVLLIDLDPQGDLSGRVGAKNYRYDDNGNIMYNRKGIPLTAPSIYEVLDDKSPDTVYADEAVQHLPQGFDIIPANQSLSRAVRDFDPADIGLLDMVCHGEDDLGGLYDYIIIDVNPAESILHNLAFTAADYVVSPAEADEDSVKGIESIFDRISNRTALLESHPTKMAIIVLTRTRGTNIHRKFYTLLKDTAEELCNKNQVQPPFFLSVGDTIDFKEAQDRHMSMQSYKKGTSSCAADYRELTETLIYYINTDRLKRSLPFLTGKGKIYSEEELQNIMRAVPVSSELTSDYNDASVENENEDSNDSTNTEPVVQNSSEIVTETNEINTEAIDIVAEGSVN